MINFRQKEINRIAQSMSNIRRHYFLRLRCPLKICFALSKSNSARGAPSIATFIRFYKFCSESLFLRPVLIRFWQENFLSHEALDTGIINAILARVVKVGNCSQSPSSARNLLMNCCMFIRTDDEC